MRIRDVGARHAVPGKNSWRDAAYLRRMRMPKWLCGGRVAFYAGRVFHARQWLYHLPMQIEYLPSGAPECPLIRIFNFNRDEMTRLREIARALSQGSHVATALHGRPGAESVGGCKLTLRRDVHDRGIAQINPREFECALTANAWENVAGFLDPFCESGAAGFQWLPVHGAIALLISHDGRW